MRVVNSTTYRNFTRSVNDVHSKLNKAMNKISSGAAYETAAENPLAYYQGKKMDNQYQDVETKLSLITDVKNRLYQQELGARSIQDLLSKARNNDVEMILNGTNNGDEVTVDTIRADLLQKQQAMINDLNAQYENFYIYGGNDISVAPFSLSADGMTLTYRHQFPGDSNITTIELEMDKATGKYTMTTDSKGGNALADIKKSMQERGYIDIGYGTIHDRSTLLDTYTGGFNLLTGTNADEAAGISETELQQRLNDSPIGLIAQAINVLDDYTDQNIDIEQFNESLGSIMTRMDTTAHKLGSVYSDLGNKYSILGTTEDNLDRISDGLEEEYRDKLGADPYQSIMEMFSYQYSYSAALQLGSKMMQSSLFDFMR